MQESGAAGAKSELSLIAVLSRQFAVSATLCMFSAAPSMILASGQGYDRDGMLTGIGFFVLAITLITSSRQYRGFCRRPHVHYSVGIAYVLRILATIFIPAGLSADLFLGSVSINAVVALLGPGKDFARTLAITILEGSLWNAILLSIALVIYEIRIRFVRAAPPLGICVTCGYNLTGNVSGICPECGTAIGTSAAVPAQSRLLSSP